MYLLGEKKKFFICSACPTWNCMTLWIAVGYRLGGSVEDKGASVEVEGVVGVEGSLSLWCFFFFFFFLESAGGLWDSFSTTAASLSLSSLSSWLLPCARFRSFVALDSLRLLRAESLREGGISCSGHVRLCTRARRSSTVGGRRVRLLFCCCQQ